MREFEFPDGFWWGSATSSHQIEGNNHNDWSEWEKSRPEKFRSSKACDSYNRFDQDFDIAKGLNQNIHRFSIEWSRIEPKEGQFDRQAMDHYINVAKSLKERGIEPMITLWHFTNPTWFAEKGGFLNIDSPKIFTRYVKYVVDNLKDRVGLWVTFNEPTTVYAGMSYLLGNWPPQNRNYFQFLKIRKHFVQAHTLAYQEIKKLYENQNPLPSVRNLTSHNVAVGSVENFRFVVAGPLSRALRVDKIFNQTRNFYFWNQTLPYNDFLGLNYYTIMRLPDSYGILQHQDVAQEMNWEIYPEGLYRSLLAIKRLKKPIFITENGIADSKDEKREKFIKDHLKAVWQAIHHGADVRGYMHWSLLDNFEWAHGFAPRFGLVQVDFNTFERKVRPSALEYAKICKENRLDTKQ